MSLALSAISITALVGATEAETPSLDFLEYLGRMVEHEGQWVDPLDMEDALFADRDEPSPPAPVGHVHGAEPELGDKPSHAPVVPEDGTQIQPGESEMLP